MHEYSYPHKTYRDNEEPKGRKYSMLLSLPYNISQFLKRGQNMWVKFKLKCPVTDLSNWELHWRWIGKNNNSRKYS